MNQAKLRQNLAVLISMASAAAAVPASGSLVFTNYFNFLDNRQSSVLGPASTRFSYGAYVGPMGGTTVSAQQGTIIQNVPNSNSLAVPTQFAASNPVSSGLTGAWTITAANPAQPNSPLSITTLPIGNVAATPYVMDVTTNGLSTTPTFSWVQPAFTTPPNTSRVTQVQIYDTSLPGNPSIFVQDLTGSATSISIPATFDTPPISLVTGHNYVVSVQTGLYNMTDINALPAFQSRGFGSELETSRSYFNFSPSTQTVPFAGAINLPRVDSNGIFNFSVDVRAGVPVLLDPSVASGYDFRIGAGDPNFASVEFPNLGNFDYDMYLWNGTSWVFDTLVAPMTDFLFGAGGVDRFRVVGIDPALMINPADATAFMTQVTFVGDGQFTGTMTPLVVSVPEPASLALIAVAFAGIGATRPRKRWFATQAR